MAKYEQSDNSEIKDDKVKGASAIDDEATEQAVDDIAKHDSDEVLEAEDAKHQALAKRPWYKKIFAEKKIWIPGAVVLLLVLLFAVPLTRYKLLGLVLKQTYKVQLTDSQTGKPVSAATVSLEGKSVMTDNKGDANLRVKLGQGTLTITKKYYTTTTESVTVGLKSGPVHGYKLKATGRQVPLTLVDKVSGKPISNAQVSAEGTTAKSDADGKLTIVLPPNKSAVSATIKANDYNTMTAIIQVTGAVVPANTFKLIPAGKVFFLSNAAGNIDVVSTNLDGSNRQTVVSGTGNEDPNNTSLLASRDWKYLALDAKRDTSKTSNAIYLVTASTGKLTTMDNGAATFTPVGWSGHYFVYEVERTNVGTNQNGHEVIKSYNADTGQIATLDQSIIATNGPYTFYTVLNNETLVGNEVVYDMQWQYIYDPNGGNPTLSGLTDSIRAVQINGQNKKDYKSFDATQYYYFLSVVQTPGTVDFDAVSNTDSNPDTYVQFANNSIKTISETEYNKTPVPTYLESPSGNLSFWGAPRDGKTSLFIGDYDGTNSKQVAALTDYAPYGWYNDNYLLVEKSGSELYIMSINGGTPQKISDYFKPAQNFNGYGGGYGGL